VDECKPLPRVTQVVDERGDERGHELQIVDHLRVDLVLQYGRRAGA